MALLEIQDLFKSFGGIIAVNGVSLRIPNGSERIVGLIGPNGAGKTTLINLVTGLIKPDRGKVMFNGIDITRKPPEERVLMGIARSFQLPAVFNDLTVRENIVLSIYKRLKLGKRNVSWDVLFTNALDDETVTNELEDLLDRFKLKHIGNRKVSELSYGHRRLLEVSMAYALKPKLLFLDEPFAGLSEPEIKDLSEILEAVSAETLLVIVEHKITWLRKLCDRLLVMHEGKLIADGSVEEALSNKYVEEVYWKRVGR